MTPLTLEPADRPDIGFRPAVLEPMFRAAEAQRDLLAPLVQIVRGLGFDSFMYGLSATTRPGRNSAIYFFATLPREWSLLYERKSYVEVDPRIALAQHHYGPLPWDREIAFKLTPSKRHDDLHAFLTDGAKYGIRSGIAWGIRDHDNHCVVALNSASSAFGTQQRERLERRLGDILVFGTYFHAFFLRNIVERGTPSRLRGAALTSREIDVLGLVACGMTADDIAFKLDIAPRTVRFHVDSAKTKMGALNREEAIALVAKAGLISVLP